MVQEKKMVWNICLYLCSFIKALRTDKPLLYFILLNTRPNIIIDCSVKFFKFTQVYFNPISFTLSRILNFWQIFAIGPRTCNSNCWILWKFILLLCICECLRFPSQTPLKKPSRGVTLPGTGLYCSLLSSSSAFGKKLWNCFKL